jgi:hypothetical protein
MTGIVNAVVVGDQQIRFLQTISILPGETFHICDGPS